MALNDVDLAIRRNGDVIRLIEQAQVTIGMKLPPAAPLLPQQQLDAPLRGSS